MEDARSAIVAMVRLDAILRKSVLGTDGDRFGGVTRLPVRLGFEMMVVAEALGGGRSGPGLFGSSDMHGKDDAREKVRTSNYRFYAGDAY